MKYLAESRIIVPIIERGCPGQNKRGIRMKKTIAAVAVILLLFGGCHVPEKQDSRIKIAAGIVPVATFIERVAGDNVDVITLIPPGYSPANFSPTAAAMQELSDAAVYFTLEMPTEQANILPKVGDFAPDIDIVSLHDAAAEVYPLLNGEDGTADPHLWLSPRRAAVMVQTIVDTLSAIDPENTQLYNDNAAAYITDLDTLDADIQQIVSQLDSKSFLIYHGAYAYFADDYGLEMISIEVSGKQATAAEMRDVIDTARAQGIKTVFYQEEFDDAQAQTVAEEIGGTVQQAAPLSPDYIDALRAFADALAAAEE